MGSFRANSHFVGVREELRSPDFIQICQCAADIIIDLVGYYVCVRFEVFRSLCFKATKICVMLSVGLFCIIKSILKALQSSSYPSDFS